MNKRQQIHKALVEAKPYLAWNEEQIDYTYSYICWAIEEAEHEGKISNHSANLAKNMIMKRLGEFLGVDNWLTYKIGWIAVKDAGKDAMQEYRHRWLDSMIKEFSK